MSDSEFQVSVKAMGWELAALTHPYGLIIRIAKTPFGAYKILKGTQGKYEVYFGDVPLSGAMDSEDAAMAWAQANYDRRVLSSINTGRSDDDLLETLKSAYELLQTASRQLTEDHKMVLMGRGWGWRTLATIEGVIAKAEGQR